MMKYGLLMNESKEIKIKLKKKIPEEIIVDIEADLMTYLKPNSYELSESISDMFGNGWFLKYDYKDACFTLVGDFVKENVIGILEEYKIELANEV